MSIRSDRKDRKQEVGSLKEKGWSNRDIADHLDINLATVSKDVEDRIIDEHITLKAKDSNYLIIENLLNYKYLKRVALLSLEHIGEDQVAKKNSVINTILKIQKEITSVLQMYGKMPTGNIQLNPSGETLGDLDDELDGLSTDELKELMQETGDELSSRGNKGVGEEQED